MPIEFRRAARALISVSDKSGLIDFARGLAALGIELISTGGTHRALVEAGLEVRDVADLTGFPELMDGRVKTLHPKVHGGLLAIRENPQHEAAMLAHGISPIDLLVVNLYPFEAAVDDGADFDECVENIDIGGPAMIRAAAKNFNDVAVIVAVEDYAPVLAELQANSGATTLALRQRLAQKAFARTAVYDAAISNWLAEQIAVDGAGLPRVRRRAAPRFCAMARTRIRGPHSTGPPSAATESRRRGSCRASSSHTTISATPTRPSSSSPNSIPNGPPPSPSSSMPTLAASPRAGPSRRPIDWRCAAIRSPPSAASSR